MPTTHLRMFSDTLNSWLRTRALHGSKKRQRVHPPRLVCYGAYVIARRSRVVASAPRQKCGDGCFGGGVTQSPLCMCVPVGGGRLTDGRIWRCDAGDDDGISSGGRLSPPRDDNSAGRLSPARRLLLSFRTEHTRESYPSQQTETMPQTGGQLATWLRSSSFFKTEQEEE